jgi:hypothetical protein
MAVMTACPGCGQHYEGLLRFCGDCGTRLTDDRIDAPTEAMVPAAVAEASDAAAVPLPDDSAATQPLPAGRLWSPGEPLPEPHHATMSTPPATAPPGPAPQLPPKRSDRGAMIALAAAACLILVVLGVALYVGGVFNGTDGGNAPNPAPASQPVTPARTSGSSTSAAPAVTPPLTTSTPAPAATAPSPPGAAQVIRTHLQDLGSGNYSGAFRLMTSAYRSENPPWPSDRSAADPGINIISIGSPQYGSGDADVPVDFLARDRNPTPGSDTQCREFQGTVHLLQQDGSWRYDPASNSLSATVSNGNSNCPS